MSFLPFLQTAGAGAAGSASGTLAGSMIPFLLIIVIFYFFLIRPQNKKQKETEKMLKALKKGDKVITIGGIHGVISSVKDNTVVVKVDDNCKIEFNRSAISTVELSDEEKAKIAAEEAAKKANKKSKKSSKEADEVEKAKKAEDKSAKDEE